MALLPSLIDFELTPRRLRDQLYGMDLTPEDMLMDIFERPVLRARHRHYMRPWRSLALLEKDAGSTIKVDKNKFQVNLDVQHFSPEEVSVKTCDGYVIVEGKHEEKKDEHGYISRQFKRRYALPDWCNAETVESKLSSDGVLTVIAVKTPSVKEGERSVPIAQTGPVRRKAHDGVEQPNGEAEEEAKSPQKKKRR